MGRGGRRRCDRGGRRRGRRAKARRRAPIDAGVPRFAPRPHREPRRRAARARARAKEAAPRDRRERGGHRGHGQRPRGGRGRAVLPAARDRAVGRRDRRRGAGDARHRRRARAGDARTGDGRPPRAARTLASTTDAQADLALDASEERRAELGAHRARSPRLTTPHCMHARLLLGNRSVTQHVACTR